MKLTVLRIKWRLGFVQSLHRVQLFMTPWNAACQAPLSFTISQSLLKFMSIESVMPSNHLILSCPLFLLSSIFPTIKVFSSESALASRGQSIGGGLVLGRGGYSSSFPTFYPNSGCMSEPQMLKSKPQSWDGRLLGSCIYPELEGEQSMD